MYITYVYKFTVVNTYLHTHIYDLTGNQNIYIYIYIYIYIKRTSPGLGICITSKYIYIIKQDLQKVNIYITLIPKDINS